MRTRVGIALCVGGFALGSFGCAQPHTPPPPPAVAPLGLPIADSARSAVVRYGRSLFYADTVCDGVTQHSRGNPYHGQCDRRLVDTLGTEAIVTPEVNIHESSAADLRVGRIQMRIEILVHRSGRDARAVYDELGVPPGVSYVWVDSLMFAGSDSAVARAVVFPVDSTLPVRARWVKVYRTKYWNQAVARWTPAQCWTCVKGSWCSG